MDYFSDMRERCIAQNEALGSFWEEIISELKLEAKQNKVSEEWQSKEHNQVTKDDLDQLEEFDITCV